MSAPEAVPLRFHEDAEFFREAVSFTAAETGFAARLIEEDYCCTALLQYLASGSPALVFKGGTCLAKVHSGFYRMSEDLDFLLPARTSASRPERRRHAAPTRAAVARLGEQLSGLELAAPLQGANDCSQYAAAITYRSHFGSPQESIWIEIGLREPLLSDAVAGSAHTLALDPVSGSTLVPPIQVPCLSRREAMAEKLRAALTRRVVAIRDFNDVDHAVRHAGLQVLEPELLALVRRKLAVPGNEPADVSPARLAALKPQLEAQLRPVLRDRDFAAFDLKRAFQTVTAVAAALG
ncbi:MAG: nucleotidyl transferase AbiEii/AbiGii toxin family protein [Planctomycetota bacterium]|nr:MAG: nucleotidyl transferase AbiEii/AbiGii toxin family protein [Planctomycetota bacterium]